MPSTLSLLLWLAVADAVLHTIAGPDHYLPFIMIARSRGYSMMRALIWTLLCGIGHVGSALFIALLFMYASHLLSESNMEWINENRGDLAAWALIGFGAAYLIYSLRRSWLHKHHGHRHGHALIEQGGSGSKNITLWVIFIIFVLGPCEALLPLLAPAAALGVGSVALVTITFSVCTIATMMLAVALGVKGLSLLRFHWLEHHSGEVAGATIMLCGIAIAFLGL